MADRDDWRVMEYIAADDTGKDRVRQALEKLLDLVDGDEKVWQLGLFGAEGDEKTIIIRNCALDRLEVSVGVLSVDQARRFFAAGYQTIDELDVAMAGLDGELDGES